MSPRRQAATASASAKAENQETVMRNTRKLAALGGTAATTVATMLFTSLAQAPQPIPPAPAAVPAILQSYQPVTAERLKNPEPNNWLMIRRTYDGWGYSPLNQINTGNV